MYSDLAVRIHAAVNGVGADLDLDAIAAVDRILAEADLENQRRRALVKYQARVCELQLAIKWLRGRIHVLECVTAAR